MITASFAASIVFGLLSSMRPKNMGRAWTPSTNRFDFDKRAVALGNWLRGVATFMVLAIQEGSRKTRWFAQAISGSPTLLSRRHFGVWLRKQINTSGASSMTNTTFPEQKIKIPKTLAQALNFIAHQAEQIECLNGLLKKQKQAVDFLEGYLEGKASKGMRKAANLLNMEPQALAAWLEDRGHIYREDSYWLPTDACVRKGLMGVKPGEVNGFQIKRLYFTAQGVAWIVNLFKKEKDSDG